MKIPSLMRSLLAVAVVSPAIPHLADAADGTKANNGNNLNGATSWVGSNAPDSSGLAIFDSTLTSNATANIGGSISWGGIQFINPANDYTIGASGSSILTLGSSGIDMSAATKDLTIMAVMDLSATQTWNVASGRKLTIGVSNAPQNTGAGTITLSGAGGTFAFGVNSTLSSGALVSGGLGTGTVNLENGIILTTNGITGRTLYNAMNLNGDISVVKNNTTTANALVLGGGVAIGSANRTITVTNSADDGTHASLIFGGGVGNTYSQVTGSGTLAFANGNTAQSPMVVVQSGTSTAGVGYARIDTDVQIGNGVYFRAAANDVFTTNTDMTVDAGGVLAIGNGAAIASTSIKSLSGGGIVGGDHPFSGSVSTLTIDGGAGTGRSTFSGNLINGGNSGVATGRLGITKTGSTTQVFAGANNYTGATTVSAGTLLINGTHIQAASTTTGAYTVASGATLGGMGRISAYQSTGNAVSVASGGILAPGDGLGTLTLDGINLSGAGSKVLNMAAGAEFNFDLAGDGSTADKVAFWNYVTGDLGLSNNAINLTLSGPLVAGAYEVTLFEFYTDSGTTLSTDTGITSGLMIGSYDTNLFVGTPALSYNDTVGTITLSYTVVPEPATVALATGGLALLLFRRRRA